MPSACDAAERHSVWETFSRHRGSVSSFLYAMWPECLTDDPTEEDEELRFAWPVLTLLASRVVSASSPLPGHLDASIHPRNNSFAGLPTGFCGSDCFMCAFLYFVNLGLSLCCHFDHRSFIILSVSTYHLFAALPFLSRCLSVISPLHQVTVTLSKPVHFLTPSPLL